MSVEYFPNADIEMLKIYDYALLKEAFDYIAHKSSVEFGFPQGGCQQRAHIMSMILDKKYNIEHCKVWLFSPAALNLYDIRTLFVPDPNGITENNRIEWNYHVVPVIRVSTSYGTELMLTDPSLNNIKPILLQEWFTLIGNSNISKYSFLLPDKYFFNSSYIDNVLTNVFDGSFFNFNELVKDDLTMEKGLALNDVAMRMYHAYIRPHLTEDKNDEKLRDLKEIFGNATVLDLLFSQNRSGFSENTSHRYVMTKYKEPAHEAKQLFNERLLFWTEFTNALL